MKVVCHRPGFEEELVDLRNKLLKHDAITIKVFERKILLDPNFDDRGLRLAVSNGRIVGFSLCLVRRYPLFYQGLEEYRGWVSVLA